MSLWGGGTYFTVNGHSYLLMIKFLQGFMAIRLSCAIIESLGRHRSRDTLLPGSSWYRV